MTKRDKQEAAIRNNPRQVRFDDLDTLMRRYNFGGDRNKPHVVYTQHSRGYSLPTLPSRTVARSM